MGYTKEVTERDLSVVPEGWYTAKLKDVTPKQVGQGTKLKWKWEILEGEFATKYLWGECWDNLDQSDSCVWRRWHEALVERPIEISENVDTDTVVGLMAQVCVTHRFYLPKGVEDKEENYKAVAEIKDDPTHVLPLSADPMQDPWSGAPAPATASGGGWSDEPPF